MSDTRTKVVPLEAEPEQWQAAFDLFNGQYHEDQMQSQIICIQKMYKAMVAAAPETTHAMPKSEDSTITKLRDLYLRTLCTSETIYELTNLPIDELRKILDSAEATPQPSTDVSELVQAKIDAQQVFCAEYEARQYELVAASKEVLRISDRKHHAWDKLKELIKEIESSQIPIETPSTP